MKTRWTRSLGISVLILALPVASLVGCSAAAPDAGPTSTADPTKCDQSALDALYAKAQKEQGAVLWYYTSPPEQTDPIAKAFAKAFPGMSLEYGQVQGQGIAGRIIQELDAGRTSADIGSSGVPELIQMRDRGLTTKLDGTELGLVNPDLLPSDDGLVLLTAASVVVYNKDLVPEDKVPTSWQELADTTWSGGFGLWEYPYAFANLIDKMPESEIDDVVDKIVAQNPVLYPSNFPLAADVGAGKIEIGVGKLHSAQPTVKSGAPIGIDLFDPISYDPMMTYVLSNSPRPNSSKLFLAWSLCGEGAKIMESALSLGNGLVPGTETASLFEGHELAAVYPDNVGELNRLLTKYGDQIRAGGTPAS